MVIFAPRFLHIGAGLITVTDKRCSFQVEGDDFSSFQGKGYHW